MKTARRSPQVALGESSRAENLWQIRKTLVLVPSLSRRVTTCYRSNRGDYASKAGEATGAGVYRIFCHALLAEVCLKAGLTEQGLRAVADGFAPGDDVSEHCFAPELLRLEGELVLQASPDDAARTEQSFQRSLAIARAHGANALELRAATSLARLWRSQGKSAEARDLLAPVYDWFAEGFDTQDLKDAKALLEELR